MTRKLNLLKRSLHENLKQAIGVILVLITTLIAFSVGSLHQGQEAHEDNENQVSIAEELVIIATKDN